MDKHDFVKARLLFKLARRRNWGNSHTAFDSLKKGFKPKDYDLVKEVAEGLIKENLLFRKPTGYGLHVSLNHKKAQEIKNIISDFLDVKVD
jgi:hypothetical protein